MIWTIYLNKAAPKPYDIIIIDLEEENKTGILGELATYD